MEIFESVSKLNLKNTYLNYRMFSCISKAFKISKKMIDSIITIFSQNVDFVQI